METKRGQDLQWASVSEKSRDVKRIVTSPLGKSENGCMIVVLRPTKVRYGWGATREVRGKGVCRVFPGELMVVLERRSKTSGMSFARAELSSAADKKGEAI